SPEAAAGGVIAAVEEGDRIIIDIPNRRLELDVPQEEIERRLADLKPLVKERTVSLAKYAQLVTSADKGAILTIE
ncbi:MAG: dihydroxy-acid dehydratase, partial [Sporomusaceae bacterium]|nr:dihydroxy-acid dehydratase [Sporomusaceae bacterium]